MFCLSNIVFYLLVNAALLPGYCASFTLPVLSELSRQANSRGPSASSAEQAHSLQPSAVIPTTGSRGFCTPNADVIGSYLSRYDALWHQGEKN